MSADQEIRKLKAQQEAQAMELQRMKMQNQARQAYVPQPDEYTITREVPPQQVQQQYNTVDDQEALIEALTQRITQQVTENVNAFQSAHKAVDNRMERLIKKYPGIQHDDDPITKQARDEYARISKENPGLISSDRGAAYELAVETAAANLGIRPSNMEYNPMQDYTLSANGTNTIKKASRSGNHLTPAVLENFQRMAYSHKDFNLDPSTPQGKANLEELNEYSERFKVKESAERDPKWR